MWEDRIIKVINWNASNSRFKYRDMESETGIKSQLWKDLANGRIKAREEHIVAICNRWPEFKDWIVLGMTSPENGQISPEIEETARDYQGTGTDT